MARFTMGRRFVLVALPVAVLAAATAASQGRGPATVTVQLLAINDFHGNLDPPAGANGLINGNASQMISQVVDIVATIVVSVVGTLIIGTIVKMVCGGLRASEDGEDVGLDLADHGEAGYSTDISAVPAFEGAH